MRATLDFTPRYDDLDTIVAHALAWEDRLAREPGLLTSPPASA
jgi:UDP-glucose 4-epimerase